MSFRRFALPSAVTLLVAGCGHSETHVALLRAPQAPSDQPIELYLAAQAAPARPFYEIALLQVVGYGNQANPEDVTQALTAKAAALGCDAVVRVFIDVGYSRAHAAGVCAKFSAPGPAGPAAVLPTAPPSNPAPPKMTPAPAPRIEPLPSAPNRGR